MQTADKAGALIGQAVDTAREVRYKASDVASDAAEAVVDGAAYTAGFATETGREVGQGVRHGLHRLQQAAA